MIYTNLNRYLKEENVTWVVSEDSSAHGGVTVAVATVEVSPKIFSVSLARILLEPKIIPN